MASVNSVVDPEMDRIKLQLLQAAAMRQAAPGSRGEMVGQVRTVGNQAGDILGKIAAPFLEKRLMDEQGQIESQRQQAEQDWISQMPEETRNVTLPPDQAGPVGTINKTPGQLAGEIRNWSAQGARLPNSALARTVAQYGIQKGIDAPQRMLEAEDKAETRRAEQEFRAQQSREAQAERLASQQQMQQERIEAQAQRASEANALRQTLAGMSQAGRERAPRVQIIQTVDEQGNPVQKVVELEPGTTFPAIPKPTAGDKTTAAERKAQAEANLGVASIDDAISELSKPSAKGALGAANMVLPESVRQYTNPEGIVPRAVIANIGSLKLHDRSGAAVTASEFPRLKPFIPSASDTPEAAVKKLGKMRDEYVRMQQEWGAVPKVAPAAGPYSDPDKEARYQAWKRSQGK